MIPEYVNPYDCIIKVRVFALKYLIVLMLLVVESLKTTENKVKDAAQVLWWGCCHEYVTVAVYNGTCNSYT